MNAVLITPAFLTGGFGMTEALVLGLLGVLIFGKRLPEVGRSVGRGIVEFKKGLAGVDDEVEEAKDKQRKRELEDRSKRDATDATVEMRTDIAEPVETPRSTS